MSSKNILISGVPSVLRRDILFQSAVNWAEEGFKVLYLKRSKFESIPSTGHGPQMPSSEVLSKIKILYLDSAEEALKSIIDILTFRDTVPRVVIVEELEEYESQESRESDHTLARICATLCYVAASCAVHCGSDTYLLVSLAQPLDKMPPVTATMFDCVWTYNCETCSLTKILPLDDFPKVQLSLLPRNDDGAFVLKSIRHLFLGNKNILLF